MFRKELDSIATLSSPRLRVVYALEVPGQDRRGERSRIDQALIEKYANDFQSRLFYICGPSFMMNALAAMIVDAGVPAKRIRTERFVL